ncbi:MAG: hypothetical protein ACM3H8_01120 [Sphingobacteriales bacterium]
MTIKLKNLCLLVFLSVSLISFSQTTIKDTSVKYSKEYIDSLTNSESFQKEFNAFVDSITGNKSYFDFSTGISNRIFSLRNNAFNTQQVITNKLTLTPTLSYINKTGMGLSWTSFLIFDGSKTGLYQHAITPSYDYSKNENISFGFSYTRYFTNTSSSYNTTPFNNEIYSYIIFKKGWLQPGLSVGWANGNYKEIYSKDTVKNVIINGVLRQIKLTIRDTIKTSLKDFSLIGTLQHSFNWFNIFNKDDEFSLTQVVMLIAGSQRYKQTQSTGVSLTRYPLRVRSLGIRNGGDNTGLKFQSAGISLTGNYYIGKFYISPQYYFDYYLPNDLSQGEKRASSIFSVTAGISF